MSRVNVVAILKDGSTITALGYASFGDAAVRVLDWMDDRWYSTTENPISLVYMSNGTEPILFSRKQLEAIATQSRKRRVG